MELSHDEIRELLPAYALGAVPDDEEALIRAHIRTCEECMQEADGFAETSSKLALTGGTESLPAGFADRVMAAAVGDRPASAPAASRRRPLWAVLSGVAVLLIAAIVTFQVVELQSDRKRQEQALLALTNDNALTLEGKEGVRAAVVPNGVGSIFAASGLPEAPEGRTYQLWLMSAGQPVSAGTFEIEDGLAVLEVAQPIEDYEDAAVTIERAGGAKEPTTDPILSS